MIDFLINSLCCNTTVKTSAHVGRRFFRCAKTPVAIWQVVVQPDGFVIGLICLYSQDDIDYSWIRFKREKRESKHNFLYRGVK